MTAVGQSKKHAVVFLHETLTKNASPRPALHECDAGLFTLPPLAASISGASGGMDGIMAESFEIGGKKIGLFGTYNEGSPLVILNTYSGEGERVFRECALLGAKPFTLAAISNLGWNADMTPWENPPIYRNGEPFSGKADEYLALLSSKIIPAIMERLRATPSYTAIAGYSLGGLFALYASYKSGLFSRIATASASLWFPRFLDFAQSQSFRRKPDAVYLSLGDAESKARNKTLATVQENAERLFGILKENGIAVQFELNAGNHFADCENRMAKAIGWILEHERKMG